MLRSKMAGGVGSSFDPNCCALMLSLAMLLSAGAVSAEEPTLAAEDKSVALVYRMDRKHEGTRDIEASEFIKAVERRLRSEDLEAEVHSSGADRLEVVVSSANADKVRRYRDAISRQGVLEFRVVANSFDHAEIQRLAAESRFAEKSEVRDGDKVVARWVPVRSGAEASFQDPAFSVRQNADGATEVLIVNDEFNVNEKHLTDANSGFDNYGGRAINFRFDKKGAQLFGALSGANMPVDDGAGGQRFRHLAIILDGEVYSAPRLNSKITDSGQITGRFTQEETDDLVSVLRAGMLLAQLTLVNN